MQSWPFIYIKENICIFFSILYNYIGTELLKECGRDVRRLINLSTVGQSDNISLFTFYICQWFDDSHPSMTVANLFASQLEIVALASRSESETIPFALYMYLSEIMYYENQNIICFINNIVY